MLLKIHDFLTDGVTHLNAFFWIISPDLERTSVLHACKHLLHAPSVLQISVVRDFLHIEPSHGRTTTYISNSLCQDS